jgi:hypothetical protein
MQAGVRRSFRADGMRYRASVSLRAHGRAAALVVVVCVGAAGCKRQSSRKERVNPAVVVVEADEEIERESQKEREPNDAPARAQKLELGATLVGTLQSSSSAADRDWFRFALKQRRVVRLQTSGAATVDLRLVLADARGQALLRVNNAGSGWW